MNVCGWIVMAWLNTARIAAIRSRSPGKCLVSSIGPTESSSFFSIKGAVSPPLVFLFASLTLSLSHSLPQAALPSTPLSTKQAFLSLPSISLPSPPHTHHFPDDTPYPFLP